MESKTSITKVINRGRIMVNIPVFIAMIILPSLTYILNLELKIVLVTCVIGFILAWGIWSIMITKWKIWAYEKVEDIDLLKRRAIKEKLIWPDGHFFERTEIRSKQDKLKLEKLEERKYK
jgi:hypothetical protein